MVMLRLKTEVEGGLIWFYFEKRTFQHVMRKAHVSIFVGVVFYLGHNTARRNSLHVHVMEGFNELPPD